MSFEITPVTMETQDQGELQETLGFSPQELRCCELLSHLENSMRILEPLNLGKNLSARGERMRNIVQIQSSLATLPMEVSGSVEVGGKASWGGKNGVEVSGYAKGEVHDDKGNYAKAEVEQKSDGTGNASVSGGHEKKDS